MTQLWTLSLLLIVSQCHLSFSASFHTISILNPTLTDWDFDTGNSTYSQPFLTHTESISATNLNGFSLSQPHWLVTWNSTSLFIALQSDILTTDKFASVFVYLDVDPPTDLTLSNRKGRLEKKIYVNRLGNGNNLRVDEQDFTELPFLADFSIQHIDTQFYTEILGESEYGRESPDVMSIKQNGIVQMEIKRTGFFNGVNEISLCAFVLTSDGTVTHILTPNDEGIIFYEARKSMKGKSLGIRSFLSFKLNDNVVPNDPSHIVNSNEMMVDSLSIDEIVERGTNGTTCINKQ